MATSPLQDENDKSYKSQIQYNFSRNKLVQEMTRSPLQDKNYKSYKGQRQYNLPLRLPQLCSLFFMP